MSPGSPQKPNVLLTHIPLSRPDDAYCGPLRERGTIRRGAGFGYVNTLDEPVSQLLLSILRPTLILRYLETAFALWYMGTYASLHFLRSGDDHDYCELDHPLPPPEDPCSDPSCSALPLHAREVTAKSFSMAMNVRRPGFQLISLKPPPVNPSQADHSIVDRPCILPDQIEVYLWGYLPLFIGTLFLLLVSNMHRVFRAHHSIARSSSRSNRGSNFGWRSTSNDTMQRHHMSQRGREGDEDTEAKLEDDEDNDDYDDSRPPFFSTPKHRPSAVYSRTFIFQNKCRHVSCDPKLLPSLLSWCLGDSSHGTRNPCVWGGFFRDVLDVAWVPLGLFAGIVWWMS